MLTEIREKNLDRDVPISLITHRYNANIPSNAHTAFLQFLNFFLYPISSIYNDFICFLNILGQPKFRYAIEK